MSAKHLCQSYSMTTGSPWWFCCLSIFFSKGFGRWGWWWWDDDLSVTHPLSFMTKRGSSFGIMRVVLYLRERVSIGFFLLAGVIYFFRDVVRILCIFLFSLFSYIILLYIGLVTIYLWHTLYLCSFIYVIMYVVFHLSLHVCFFSLSLYTCFFMYAIFYFCFTQDALMSFV